MVTVTVNKADATVTNWPTATPITVGQSLSSSTLSGGSATGVGGANVEGAFAWTSSSSTPSATGSFEVTFTPTSSNYKTATQMVSVAVNSAGPNFGTAFEGRGASALGADGMPNLLRYAMGANNPSDSVVKPVSSVDSSSLNITAIVRTNDPKVSIVGENSSALSSWNTNGVIMAVSSNTNGVPVGCQRQVFSVDRTNSPSKQFLRLKATLQP
jgi:hypothetical protein